MNDINMRNPCDNDIPGLRGIWKEVFGSTGEEAFFAHFYDPAFCVMVEYEGSPAAAGYLVPFGSILNGQSETPCAMLYSIATLPGYRGKGFGSAVVRRLTEIAYEHKYSAVVLCPSEDSLFEYYKTHTGFFDWFYTGEQVYKNEFYNCGTSPLIKLSAYDYMILREEMLEGITHIKHDLRVWEYQEYLCNELGGGLYRIGDSCAVIECQSDSTVWIKELLTNKFSPCNKHTTEIYRNESFIINTDNTAVIITDKPSAGATDKPIQADIIASIAAKFPADEYTVRYPAQTGSSRRYGMLISACTSQIKTATNSYKPWYGMAYD